MMTHFLRGSSSVYVRDTFVLFGVGEDMVSSTLPFRFVWKVPHLYQKILKTTNFYVFNATFSIHLDTLKLQTSHHV